MVNCPYCGQYFGTWEEMVDHINTVHPLPPTPPEEPPPPPTYTCPECGAVFSSPSELESHIATRHPPEPPEPEPEPAEFKFDSWNPAGLDFREVFIVGAAWPAVVRKVNVGESVYAHFVVKNIGGVAGRVTITVKDLDTGSVVKTWIIPDLAPKARFKTSSPGVYIGKMPSTDWLLEFKVKP